jgi:hypothetical protein
VLCRECALSVTSTGHATIPRVVHSSVHCVLTLSPRTTVLDHHPPHSLPLRRRPTGVKKQPQRVCNEPTRDPGCHK